MEGFCAYCGRQLEAGETCNCREPRTYSTYDEPADSGYNTGSDSYNTGDNNYYQNQSQDYYNGYSKYRQGYYTSPEQFQREEKVRKARNMSIASMVIGIESLVSCWSGISLIPAILSLVLAIVARKQFKENPSKLPTIALVISILAIVLTSCCIFIFAFLFFTQ